MKFKTLVLILFLIQSLTSFACLDATQHKIFPIGVLNGKVITINVHIHRTHSNFKKQNNEGNYSNTMWVIKSYISIYDYNQNLISKSLIEESQIHEESYLSALQSSYSKGVNQIESKYHNIEYFIPDYISFCDFQKRCEILEIKHDTINKKDYLKYKNIDYAINLNEYNNYKKSMLYSGNLTAYYLSSTRIYKAKNLELVIGHLETGHEISMGWITNNLTKKPKSEFEVIIVPKEHKPEIVFDKLDNVVYKEPLLHHGYGFDFFIVTEN